MLLCNDLVHKLLDFFFVALIREMFLLAVITLPLCVVIYMH